MFICIIKSIYHTFRLYRFIHILNITLWKILFFVYGKCLLREINYRDSSKNKLVNCLISLNYCYCNFWLQNQIKQKLNHGANILHWKKKKYLTQQFPLLLTNMKALKCRPFEFRPLEAAFVPRIIILLGMKILGRIPQRHSILPSIEDVWYDLW